MDRGRANSFYDADLNYDKDGRKDEDQESSDGRSTKKTKKCAVGKLQPTITFIPSEEQFVLHSQTNVSSYDCLSLLRQKCSGGTQPRAIGKMTPRIPISYTHVNISTKNFISPARQGLKIKADADDEVAHEIAITLADAQKDGSPLVSRIPNKRPEDVMSSPNEPDQPKKPIAEMNDSKLFAIGMDGEVLEGQTKAVIGERSRHKPYMMEPISCGTERKKGIKLARKKQVGYDNNEENLDGTRKELCGNKESHLFCAIRSKFATQVNGVKICRPLMQSQRRADEGPSFDALQTLADLSSMMQTENGDVLEALPMNQQKRICRSSRVKTEGHKSVSSIEAACRKTSKSGKGSVIDVRSIPEENQDPHSSIPRRPTKKQKIHVSEEAVVLESRHMNDDVVENQKDGDSSLNDSELFKRKHAMVLAQSSEANEEVSSALFGFRHQNTYQGNSQFIFPRPVSNVSDPDGALNSSGESAFQAKESGTHVSQIIDGSRTKAQSIVDAAMQIPSLKNTEDTVKKIGNALGYANNHIPPDDSRMPVNCTERRVPLSDIAQILDSAITSLRPRSSHNLPIYTEIQRCMGIIRNQIMALIPT